MIKSNEKEIARLQENLSVIRKIAGWTTEDLGERIGVTKQTISNLENNKTTMTLTQYIAIRSVLDYELQTNPENVALAQIVDILLNQEAQTDEDEQKIKKVKTVLAAAAAGGVGSATLASISSTLFATEGIKLASSLAVGAVAVSNPLLAGAIGVGSSIWMSKIIQKKNKKK